MSRFEDQVAIVTGAGEGLGFGIAQRLGSEGAKITIVDMNADVAEQASQALAEQGVDSEVVLGDVGEDETAQQAVQTGHRPVGAHRHLGEQRGHRGPLGERVGAAGRGDGPGVPDEPTRGVTRSATTSFRT